MKIYFFFDFVNAHSRFDYYFKLKKQDFFKASNVFFLKLVYLFVNELFGLNFGRLQTRKLCQSALAYIIISPLLNFNRLFWPGA